MLMLQGRLPPFREPLIALLLLGLFQIQQGVVEGYPCCANKDCSSTMECWPSQFCDYRENLDGYSSFGCIERGDGEVEDCYKKGGWFAQCLTFTNITEAKEKLKGCFDRYGLRKSDIQYQLGLLQPGIRITCLPDRCNHCKGPATTTTPTPTLPDRCNHCKGPATTTIPTTTPTPTTDTSPTTTSTTRTTTRKRSTTTRRGFRKNVRSEAGQYLKPEWNLTLAILLTIPSIVRAILASF